MKNLFILLIMLMFCGCVSKIEKAETRLKAGMSKDEVFAIMGYPDRKTIWDREIEYWYDKSYRDTVILVFDKYNRYMYWRSPQYGASSSSSDSQLDAINTSIQNLNTTIQTNEAMRRNGL